MAGLHRFAPQSERVDGFRPLEIGSDQTSALPDTGSPSLDGGSLSLPQNSLDSLDIWTEPINTDASPSRHTSTHPPHLDEEGAEETEGTDILASVKKEQDEILRYFNARYAYTDVGSDTRKPAIVEFDPSGHVVCRRQIADFLTSCRHLDSGAVRVAKQDADGRITVTYELKAKWWLKHPKHRSHPQLLLSAPGSSVRLGPRDYNLWRGFAPQREVVCDWSENCAFIFDVICNGDGKLFEYVLNWMAALVQYPGRRAHSAILLHGGQGIGKGHFAETILGKLFHPKQYTHLHQTDELTGDFTEHLTAKVLVFADECFFENRKAANRLKALITEEEVSLHPKHFPRFKEPSSMHLILASNAERPIPVERDDRRFLICEVSEARKSDIVYFRMLTGELENGGRAAMLRDLREMSVNEDWLRVPLVTASKMRMKAESLGPFEIFWQEVLADADGASWQTSVRRDDLHARFARWWADHRYSGPVPVKNKLGAVLSGLFKRGGLDRYPLERREAQGNRPRLWVFPSLPDCRQVFCKATGTTPAWEPELDTEGQSRVVPRRT
jgi:hypothetical protein